MSEKEKEKEKEKSEVKEEKMEKKEDKKEKEREKPAAYGVVHKSGKYRGAGILGDSKKRAVGSKPKYKE